MPVTPIVETDEDLAHDFTVGDRRTLGLLSMMGLIGIIFFAQYWFRLYHIPHSLHGPIGKVFDCLLFLLVAYVVWHPILMNVCSWAVTFLIQNPKSQAPEPGLRVALITTFVPQSESVNLLYKCLPAMVKADYPHDTWLLDEGNIPEVRQICEMLGVNHYSRAGHDHYNTISGKYSRKTKGGNHNSWYDQHGDQYDFVAQMDTDFLPKQNFLTNTLGYFKDARVGFVGTPQIYGNTDESIVANGAAQQAYKFYGPVLRGFSGMGTMLMIGANHVVRVKALKEVDHYSAHITEDLITGMKLHAKGWKSVYVPEALAIGEGPATWEAFFNQQMRWAYGCFDILFRYSPKLLRHMTLKQACYYYFTQQYYFSGLTMVLGLIALGLYSAFGVTSAAINIGVFLKYYVPVLIICELMELWLQRFNIRPKHEQGLLLAGRITSLAACPIFFLAFVSLITGKRLVYKVTPKGIETDENSNLYGSFTAHFIVATYCIFCFILAIAYRHISIIMLFWLALSAITMLLLPFSESIYRLFNKPDK